MKLFAGNKSTKLQRKLQQEEQILFEKEQAQRRAQIDQDEKLAKQLQDEENGIRGDSSPQQPSPPPLPARPPKPLAYYPEYLPRQQSDPSPTTPTTQSHLPFGRIRTASTPSVLETSTFPPRSPIRTSPTPHNLPTNGRSSPPLYPPTITPTPPSRPTSTQSYPRLSTVPPNPSTSAPPTFPRRDPVMFIVPAPHSNTAPPPAPRNDLTPAHRPTMVGNSTASYPTTSSVQNMYKNNSYKEHQPAKDDYTTTSAETAYSNGPAQSSYANAPTQTSYSTGPIQTSYANGPTQSSYANGPAQNSHANAHYNSHTNAHYNDQQQPSDYYHYPQINQQHNNASSSSHLPVYPTQHQNQPTQHDHQQQSNRFATEKPDEVREKQLYEKTKKKRSDKVSPSATAATVKDDDSDSDSDNYSDFVVRVGPMVAYKKMSQEKTTMDISGPEKQLQEHEDHAIDLVDPFADANAIQLEEDTPDVDPTDGISLHDRHKEAGEQVGFGPLSKSPSRPSLMVDTEIPRSDSSANFRKMQARLSALLNGAPEQPKPAQGVASESTKVEKEDEDLSPDEKVEVVNEVTVASVNTPAQFHSPLHTRSKSTPPEPLAAHAPQPYTRTTPTPKLARPPIPKTPKPQPSRSRSFSESPTSPSGPRRHTVAEPALYPPTITPSLPPATVPSQDVLAGIPQNEFGFYRVDTPLPGHSPLERKALPHLPPNLPKEKSENRHITCKLPKHFTAGHRVWIAIKPADTGKTLAQRIHVVATFRTMKITSLQSATGRQIPLDNTPVFGTWQEIENFQDGELWTFETGGEPENFLIQGGKDWFKQMISNMRE